MSNEFVNEEVPGVGRINGRAGTSTIELAGAVNFWHQKYQTAWRSGFGTATFTYALFAAIFAAYKFLL